MAPPPIPPLFTLTSILASKKARPLPVPEPDSPGPRTGPHRLGAYFSSLERHSGVHEDRSDHHYPPYPIVGPSHPHPPPYAFHPHQRSPSSTLPLAYAQHYRPPSSPTHLPYTNHPLQVRSPFDIAHEPFPPAALEPSRVTPFPNALASPDSLACPTPRTPASQSPSTPCLVGAPRDSWLSPAPSSLSSPSYRDSFEQSPEYAAHSALSASRYTIGSMRKKTGGEGRHATACDVCCRRKEKCDKKIPCSRCTGRNVAHLCTYHRIADVHDLSRAKGLSTHAPSLGSAQFRPTTTTHLEPRGHSEYISMGPPLWSPCTSSGKSSVSLASWSYPDLSRPTKRPRSSDECSSTSASAPANEPSKWRRDEPTWQTGTIPTDASTGAQPGP